MQKLTLTIFWRESEVIHMLVYYDLQSRGWFLKPNGLLVYIPDPELVWDAKLDKRVAVLHVDHLPGREDDLELQSALGKLIPFRAMVS